MAEDKKALREYLRSKLPPGVPLPDGDNLDYSFAIEYVGPLPNYEVPKAPPLPAHHPSSSRGGSKIDDHRVPTGSTPGLRNVATKTVESASHSPPDSPDSASTSSASSASHKQQGCRRSSLEAAEANDSPLVLPSFTNSPSFATIPEHRFGAPIAVEKSRAPNLTESTEQADFNFPTEHSISRNREGDVGASFSHKNSDPTLPSGRLDQLHQRKKGVCSKCLKGNRLQEKEACIACELKYCCSCMLRAMGSMPEGRKCVDCIGKPINESRRPYLGKPSRLLNRILSPLEVQQIMKAERECPANQLRPEQLIVNGRELRPEEMADLLGCKNPPLKLKPGSYWYDRQSGLWGKEGEKPDQIISPDLNVGDAVQGDASGGNTNVYMNGRQITRIELKMLKFSGVQCPPGTHLWVYPDGSFQEEGQNNIRGNIWGKATIKFLYPLFSLPLPRSHLNGSNEDMNNASSRSIPGYLEQKKVHKLLLTGFESSGTSTIFKQGKYLYNDQGFSQEEIQNMKLMIQCNVYKYISIILEGRERFEEEEEYAMADACVSSDATSSSVSTGTASNAVVTGDSEKKSTYSINAKLRHVADWILEIMASGDLEAFFPAATREYAPLVEDMWKDPAVQATYSRKAELHMLPDVASYFIERVAEISTNEYEPTECDIIYAEGISQGSGLAEIEFSLDERSPSSESYNDNYEVSSAGAKYQLIRVSCKGMNEGCKWLELFEDVRAIVFCVALSDYDQMWTDGRSPLRNKMIASRDLFESILRHPCFRDKPFVLFLNKYDLFEDKIRNVPLTVCDWFSDFDPVSASRHTPQSLAQQAYTYVAFKYKKFYENINTTGRKLYTFQLKARDRSMVGEAFQYVKEVLKWEDAKLADWTIVPEDSFTDVSSFSPFLQESAH